MQFSLSRLMLAVTCFAIASWAVAWLRNLRTADDFYVWLVAATVLIAVYLPTIAIALLVRKDWIVVKGLLLWILSLGILMFACSFLHGLR